MARKKQKYEITDSSSFICNQFVGPDEFEEKRFYHGATIEGKCPTCGGTITQFDCDYFSYPPNGQFFDVVVLCDSCAEKDPDNYEGHTGLELDSTYPSCLKSRINHARIKH